MTTQKTLKRRVRARAAKTGESYTAARAQLLRPTQAPIDTKALAGVSEEAMLGRTGRPLTEWFAMLDAWGATERTHTQIARWLRDEQGVDGWWSQTITVAHERAHGRRVLHQTAGGFSVGVTRTMAAGEERVLVAFRDSSRRAEWLPDGGLEPNAAYRGRRGRYDWTDPPSRVWVDLVAKADGRTAVTITHERLPDADAAERTKGMWRQHLGALTELLESD